MLVNKMYGASRYAGREPISSYCAVLKQLMFLSRDNIAWTEERFNTVVEDTMTRLKDLALDVTK